MTSKKKKKKLLQEVQAKRKNLSTAEEKYLGVEERDKSPYVALKYYQHRYQCFSEWGSAELKAFASFVVRLPQTTWTEIRKTGGKPGSKVGFGYTEHKNKKELPSKGEVDGLSPDIGFIELRVTKEARVHGFRVAPIFFLVWLDRNHDIYPS